MTEPIVAVSGLQFAYGDIVALAGVDLELPPGRVGLVGANGAGKTTLLKLLLGILPPAAGSIGVLGRPVPGDLLGVRSRVGFMPEGDCLPPDQTAADFVGYAAELAGLPVRAARQRASDVLASQRPVCARERVSDVSTRSGGTTTCAPSECVSR